MKSSVPVFLDTSGVIGLDRVDDLRRLGELDDKLAFAASQSVRSADLVKAAGLHQVDVAQLAGRVDLRHLLCRFGIVVLGRRSTQFREAVLAPVRSEERRAGEKRR